MAAAPVALSERFEILDVLRGIAVLGILLVNIVEMGMPSAAAMNPSGFGGSGAADQAVWFLTYVFVETKMRTIFTLLFGAGAYLFIARYEQRTGESAKRIYWRRCLVLGVFGLAHTPFWAGDILLGYAIAGPAVYYAREWTPRQLFTRGALLLLPLALLASLVSLASGDLPRLEEKESRRVLDADEKARLDMLRDSFKEMRPGAQETGNEILARRGRLSALLHNIRERSFLGATVLSFTDTLSLFLIGMGAWKAGILTGARTSAFYRRMALSGFGIGIPLFVWSSLQWRHEAVPILLHIGPAVETGRVAMAAGYVAIAILWLRTGFAKGIATLLAEAGRMALTNYIAASLLALAIFSGFGFGLFAKLSRAQLLIPVAAIWSVQLAFSHWWLARNRFGPLEWLWRRLTYGKLSASAIPNTCQTPA